MRAVLAIANGVVDTQRHLRLTYVNLAATPGKFWRILKATGAAAWSNSRSCTE
jgi:hypothetical protein